MKLTSRDIATTALLIFGGMIVYAKFYNFDWADIGGWRSATALLGLTGIVMAVVNRFDFANRSILNITEMILAIVGIGVGVVGVFVASATLFYTLAAILLTLWALEVGRHTRHSVMEEEWELTRA